MGLDDEEVPFLWKGTFFFYKKWLCHIIWLIFDGEMLRNPTCFACLHTAGVCALTKRLPFLYSSRRVAEINSDKINRSQRQNLKNKKNFQVFSKEKKGKREDASNKYYREY